MENNLSTRENFLKIFNFESCNRTLKWEFAYWVGALKNWYKEDLPQTDKSIEKLPYGDCTLGPGSPWPLYSVAEDLIQDNDVTNYFNLDEQFTIVPYNFWLYPKFNKEIISEDEKYIEINDSDGIRKRLLKDQSSMPMWLEYPVKDRKDWEKIKEERFSPENISKRYAENFSDFMKKARNGTFPLGIFGYPTGFFGSLRFLLGEEKLFTLYYDDPDLIKDILNHLFELWVSIAEELLSKINFDIACFWEDMSGKNGSLISPATFKEFMSPLYRKMISYLKQKGIKNFVVDTDGQVKELIPLFLNVGINAMYPFERQAGNDLVGYRKDYPELVMMGGIDKKAVAMGKEYIDRELSKMEYLISRGGFIPFIDHAVPPDVSWENFKYYRNKLNNIIDHTKVL